MAEEDETRTLCCNCTVETSLLHIQCHECKDLRLCSECFASGAELGDHKRNHRYCIVNNGAFHAFSSEWSAYRDLRVLEAIEQCGFGNWIDTSYVNGGTAEECKKHFQETFIEGKLGQNLMSTGFHSKALEETGGEVPPLASDPQVTAGSGDLTVTEQRDLGYMPMRGDFDLEEDNEAEALVSSLTVGVAETGLEAALRFVHPEAYLFRARERDRRKKISQQLRLISSRHLSAVDGGNRQRSQQSIETESLLDLLKPFARFLSYEENEEFQKSVIREKQLKCRIEELLEFRENGVTRLSASHEFKLLLQHRERAREATARRRSFSFPLRRVSSGSSGSRRAEKVKKQDGIQAVDISHMTGIDALGHREQQVCTTLNLTPSRYMTLKGLIVKDYAVKQRGMTVKTRYPVWLEKSHKKYIFSFLRDSGWLPTT